MGMTTGRRGGPVAEINVTPMADVVIVLVIIFMVAVSAMGRDVVQLPPALRSLARNGPTVVVVKANGGVLLGDRELPGPAALLPELQMKLEGAAEAERVVRVKADLAAAFEDVQGVLALCRQAGASEVALMTTLPSGS